MCRRNEGLADGEGCGVERVRDIDWWACDEDTTGGGERKIQNNRDGAQRSDRGIVNSSKNWRERDKRRMKRAKKKC